MATRDMLIFPSAITQILRDFSVSFPTSPHFSIMGAIDRATVRWSKGQLQPWQPWIGTVAPPTSTDLSSFAPSSSMGGCSP